MGRRPERDVAHPAFAAPRDLGTLTRRIQQRDRRIVADHTRTDRHSQLDIGAGLAVALAPGTGLPGTRGVMDGVPKPGQVLNGRIRHQEHRSTAPTVAAIGSAPWRMRLTTE